MERSKVNYFVDVLALISFLITGITGLIMYFFFEKGIRQGGYQEFLGVTKSTITNVHNHIGLLMVLLVLIHFILHWDWFFCMTKSLFASKKKK
jgi:hypothetical protein